jgi:hypothetical protein
MTVVRMKTRSVGGIRIFHVAIIRNINSSVNSIKTIKKANVFDVRQRTNRVTKLEIRNAANSLCVAQFVRNA